MANGQFLNKVAIVTGASSGLGQATAILFAKKGACITLCGRNESRLKFSMDQCVEASGGDTNRFIHVQGDVTKPEVRKAVVAKTIDKFQRLDILVANAGVLLPENGVGHTTEPVFDYLFNTNVKAVYFLIQDALPYLEKSRGNIVNVSSILSTLAAHGRPIYPMTKASVDHMTRCLALDLAPRGIRVNAVNPSHVPSRMYRYSGDDRFQDLVQKGIQRESPKQPLYGKCVTTEAVADTIAFLASDAATFVTGQCHLVDGGRNYNGAL